jgi:hypothetical protein
MLGKLMKHEFRATARVMLPLIGALLVVSLMANFSFRANSGTASTFLDIMSTFIIVLFFLAIFAVGIATVVIMINRFRSNLLKDEGYITFTLPVSMHSIIWSKLIVSTIWFAATFLIIALSAVISQLSLSFLKDFWEIFKSTVELFFGKSIFESLNLGFMALEGVIIALLISIAALLTFYASLSVGHGFANKKVLLSIVTFLIIIVVTEVISALVQNIFITFGIELPVIGKFAGVYMAQWNTFCFYTALILIIYSAIMYVITAGALKKHLNLE